MADKCKELIGIEFCECNKINDLQSLSSLNNSLLEIKIKSCKDVTIQSCVELTRNIPNLQHLEYAKVNDIDGISVLDIAAKEFNELYHGLIKNNIQEEEKLIVTRLDQYFTNNTINLSQKCAYLLAVFFSQLNYVSVNYKPLNTDQILAFRKELVGVNTFVNNSQLTSPVIAKTA